MKRSIKNLVALTILFIIVCIVGTVNAASVSMSLTSNSKLVEGQTVEVTLKITNIDAGDGIDAITGTLNYDKNVFEEVTIESFEGINRWSIQGYSEESGIFIFLRSSKVNMQSDVLKITLKAKTAVVVNSSIIEIKELTASGGDVASGGTGDIEIQAVNVTINKASQITPDDPNKTNTDQGGQTTTPTTNTQKPVNTQSPISSNNTPNTKLPQTGDEYGIVLAIAVVAIISIIAYIRYKNVNIK